MKSLILIFFLAILVIYCNRSHSNVEKDYLQNIKNTNKIIQYQKNNFKKIYDELTSLT